MYWWNFKYQTQRISSFENGRKEASQQIHRQNVVRESYVQFCVKSKTKACEDKICNIINAVYTVIKLFKISSLGRNPTIMKAMWCSQQECGICFEVETDWKTN